MAWRNVVDWHGMRKFSASSELRVSSADIEVGEKWLNQKNNDHSLRVLQSLEYFRKVLDKFL